LNSIGINSCVLNGFKITDKTSNVKNIDVGFLDVLFVVIGWEERSFHALEAANLRGDTIVLVSFEGDGISSIQKQKFIDLAKIGFAKVEHKSFCNAKNIDQLRGQLEAMVDSISTSNFLQIAIDYSSMPRVMVQTLFRLLISDGICPRIHWIYSSGKYDTTQVVENSFHQGVVGDLFSVHGANGSGAVSEKRIGVAALGGDQELVAMFLRHENYDDVYFLDAPSISSPKLEAKIRQQRGWLQSEHGIDGSQFYSCNEHNVVEAVGILSEIMNKYSRYPNASFDVFCAGPKTHSIAASAVISRFENVRLLGRVPSAYARLNVLPTGSCTVTCVSDYTNIRIAELLLKTSSERT
jgi:hypothetical protein